MSNKPGNKILRIGLIQNGRIVEERLMRSAKPITIGHGLKKNTLVVPASKLPKSFKLFEPNQGGYTLYFTSQMSGRISLGDGVRTLDELVKEGKAKKSGEGYVLELSRRARGKLSFGEVTILFQFVTPPPPRPKPVLPASMRGGWFKGIEPFLGAVIAISAVLQIGFVVWLENQDFPPSELRQAEIADRFVKIMAEKEEEPEPPKDEEKEPEKTEEGEGEAQAKNDKPQPKPQPKAEEEKVEKEEEPKTAEERAQAEAERRKRMAAKVRQETMLHEIGALAEGGNLADTLSEGAGSTTMDEAFAGSTGVTSAELGAEKSGVRSSGSSAAEGSGSAAGIGGLGKTSGAKAAEKDVDTGSKKEETVKARIDIKGGGEPVGSGKLSASRISRVVHKGASGIQRCYERVLKQNPNEGGKLVITVTIGQAGTVTSVATQTSIGGGFEGCVKSRVKGWKFPRPRGGEVMFNKTFVLSK